MDKIKTFISPWSNVDGKMMREILDNYLMNPEFSNKILEILRLRSIVFEPRIRVFLGQGIRMRDYPEYNLPQIQSLNNLRENLLKAGIPKEDVPDFVESVSSICFWEGGPRVTPLVKKEIDLEYATLTSISDTFGDSILYPEELKIKKERRLPLHLSFWMHIDEKRGKYVLPSLTREKPIFRIRSIELEAWRKITEEYISLGNVCPDYISEDDIKLSDILI